MTHYRTYWLGLVAGLFAICGLADGCLIKDARTQPETRGMHLALQTGSDQSTDHFQNALEPESAQPGINKEILDQLTQRHYQKVALDDQFSERFFNRYVSDLDSERIYFTARDISEFETYRLLLDDSLKAGELKPAFRMFNRYHQRIVERFEFLVSLVEDELPNMDFNVEETMQTDRENAPWPENTIELHDLWRKRLKNDALNLRLAGKSQAEIVDLLDKRYRSQLNRVRQTNSQDAFRVYMNALTRTYDPHTQYFPPRISENFNIQMSLSLEGIGAVLQNENEYTKVLRLVPAGPAEKAKQLKPGDRIVGVAQGDEGELIDVIGWRIDDVVELIRGPKNTLVRLEIIPIDAADDHQTKIIKITRNTVQLEDQAAQKKIIKLEHENRSYTIGVIDLPTFYIDFRALQAGDPDYRSSTRDVQRLLKELKQAKVDGVIIDLRDNGGGALQEANALTGLFIEKGPVVQVRNANLQISEMRDRDPAIEYSGPLVVLVNRLSASASEIFAGAIQDYRRGIVLGTQTFGKGTVQSLIPLTQGQLKLTLAKFYRISGKSTQHQGIIPDISFPAIYDPLKIGESALPDALPYDTIQPVRYSFNAETAKLIDLLRLHHENRIKASPDFAYIVASLRYLNQEQKKSQVSLREVTRRQEKESAEQWRIDLENKRRKAKGLEPVKSIADIQPLDLSGADNFEPGDETEADPFLMESGHVLCDFIYLSRGMLVKK